MLKKIMDLFIIGFLCFQPALGAEFYPDAEDNDYKPIYEHYHINQSVYNTDVYRVRHTSYQTSYDIEQYVPCHVHSVLPDNLQPIDVKNNIYDRFFHLKEPAQIPEKQVFIERKLLEPIEVSDAYLQNYEKKIFTRATYFPNK
jgi:hypothetical protein